LNDLQLQCVDCGEAFVFTEDEQRFYAERGIRQPVRCGSCRAERRAERNASLISGYESLSESSRWHEINNGAAYGLINGEARRQQSRGPRTSFHAVCATCGKDTEVPFMPRSGRPVYCRECYAARKGR
jgi:CxxC-x17-CxxC domain-containing protein